MNTGAIFQIAGAEMKGSIRVAPELYVRRVGSIPVRMMGWNIVILGIF